MLFRIQRQLDHPFQNLVGLHPREIVVDELLAEQAADIAKFPAFLFTGIYEVPVAVVDHDHIFPLVVP